MTPLQRSRLLRAIAGMAIVLLFVSGLGIGIFKSGALALIGDPSVLILDELKYVPCDARAADLLFRIISCRHEQRSVVLTTNLAYKQWSSVFPEASCLSTLIDRFAQHCHVVDIDADSWRQKSSLRRSPRKPLPKR